jgi:hypothetical protein
MLGGFGALRDILYDGANIWVIESDIPGKLIKLDANGAVLQTVTVGNAPFHATMGGGQWRRPTQTPQS